MNERAGQTPQETWQAWRDEYVRQLDRRIDITLNHLDTEPTTWIRAHLRSFLTLLTETHRFPKLAQKGLILISRLHPMPLRWGMGHAWETELLFALEHIPKNRPDLAAEYHCSLGDVYQFHGAFDAAIAEAETVLNLVEAPLEQVARACRIAFTCYRARGETLRADALIDDSAPRFYGDLSAKDVPQNAAQAWLKFQQCRLELLRERGQVDRALALAGEMIWLYEKQGSPDPTLTADLLTHRSTLLWVRGRYAKAVSDLKRAMELFRQAEDEFNAESLKSNLGLVYWTMGKLDLAETTLQESIRYYRRSGSEQLLTYDIANLGLVYFARGDLDSALSLTQEHIELARKIDFVHELHRGQRNLGTILNYFGEFRRSIEETTAAHRYYERRGSRDAYWLDVLWLALCEFALGEQEKALAMVRETLERAIELKSQVLEQVTLRCLAALLPPPEREGPLQCLPLLL